MSGGAVQENWALDAELDGAAQRWVLRTDAQPRVAESLTRAQEFAVLKVAHAAGVAAPEPLFLCEDPAVTGRTFFIMQRLPGIAHGHKVTRDPEIVPDAARLAREVAANLARLHRIAPPQAGLGLLPTMRARVCVGAYRVVR